MHNNAQFLDERNHEAVHLRPCLKGMFLQLMKEETSKCFCCEYSCTRKDQLENHIDAVREEN